jgi:hypothetical protein
MTGQSGSLGKAAWQASAPSGKVSPVAAIFAFQGWSQLLLKKSLADPLNLFFERPL